MAALMERWFIVMSVACFLTVAALYACVRTAPINIQTTVCVDVQVGGIIKNANRFASLAYASEPQIGCAVAKHADNAPSADAGPPAAKRHSAVMQWLLDELVRRYRDAGAAR